MQLSEKSRDFIIGLLDNTTVGTLGDAREAIAEALAICEAKARPAVQEREVAREIEDLRANLRAQSAKVQQLIAQCTSAEAQRDLLKELVVSVLKDRGECRY